MKIHFLGGTGEYGRSSYLIRGEKNILLDFGVKRIENGQNIGAYPKITKDLANQIDFVLLSHAHDDHSSALPLLYKLGYKGYVYATEETISLAKTYILNWAKNVRRKGGKLPYDGTWIEKVKFSPLVVGENIVEGIKVKMGRTGHMPGSVWFDFSLGGKRVFYSGDLCFESMLFAYDIPLGNYDVAIVDASYGRDDTPQEVYTEMLWKKVEEIVARGGNMLFPVPAKGRGMDLLLMLNNRYEWLLREGVKVYVEGVVLDGIEMIKGERYWLKREGIELLSRFKGERFERIIDENMVIEMLGKKVPIIVIANDAMLSGGSSPLFFNAIKERRENGIIFTGYLAPGTPGYEISTQEGKKTYEVRSEVTNIRIKAHLGFSELRDLLLLIKPRDTFLVHCDREVCEPTAKVLKSAGLTSHCLLPGDIWEAT